MKMAGSSPFLIIAPHAAGDDLKTGFFAKKLAKSLGAFFVINKKYKKPENTQASLFPEYIQDFNKLSWSQKKQRYLWKNKKPAMKLFYEDIKTFTESARKLSLSQKVFSIHIHGMNHENGIDIGAGVKFHPKSGIFQNSFENTHITKNSGSETIRISKLKNFYKKIQEGASSEIGQITIGKFFPGWSRHSGIQWHLHHNKHDAAIHLEIGKSIRFSKKIRNECITQLSPLIKNILL